MARTARRRLGDGPQVGDRGEQARDDVEPLAEVELDHVGLHEADLGTATGRGGEHVGVEVDADAAQARGERLDVPSRAAGDVEERRRRPGQPRRRTWRRTVRASAA